MADGIGKGVDVMDVDGSELFDEEENIAFVELVAAKMTYASTSMWTATLKVCDGYCSKGGVGGEDRKYNFSRDFFLKKIKFSVFTL